MDEYCADQRFIGWFETSAKEDINISDAAKYLVSKVNYIIFNTNCLLTQYAKVN